MYVLYTHLNVDNYGWPLSVVQKEKFAILMCILTDTAQDIETVNSFKHERKINIRYNASFHFKCFCLSLFLLFILKKLGREGKEMFIKCWYYE